MNEQASLRWLIARRQLDGVPARLSLRTRRDYWAFRLYDASDELAEQMPEDAA